MKCWPALFRFALFAAALALPGRANEIFIKIPGVPGESTTSGYPGVDGWSEIQAVQFSASRTEPGPGGVVQFSGIHFSKVGDSTSPLLFARVVQGTTLNGMIIEYSRINQGLRQKYLTIELEGAVLDSQSSSTSGERPEESFTIRVTQMRMTWRKYNDQGTEITPAVVFPAGGGYHTFAP
jgi:type VI secretion system Hcp family effector